MLVFIVLKTHALRAQVSDFKSLDLVRVDNRVRSLKGASLGDLPKLAHRLTQGLPTEVEKFRAIYTWVCTNIKGDRAQHNMVGRMRKKLKNDSLALVDWNAEYKKVAFAKLKRKKKTMCTGYAYLIKELCYLAGIEAVIIDGYGRTVDANVTKLENANHSWNAVRLNDKWYLCDATWSSGYMEEGRGFVSDYNDGYFLTDPVLFGKNHYPLEQKWSLQTTFAQEDFAASPLVYGNTFAHRVIPLLPKKMETVALKNETVFFSLKTLTKVVDPELSMSYYSNNEEKTLTISNLQWNNDTVSFTHQFKRKGIFDIHLKVNDDVIATYVFKVTDKDQPSGP